MIIEPLYFKVVFWICIGLFVFFSGNFLGIVSLGMQGKSPELIKIVGSILAIVTITKNVILSLALLGKVDDGHANKDELVIPDDVVLDDFKLTNLKKH